MDAKSELTKHYGSESEHWHGLLAAFEAEIRKDAASVVRGMTPKYLDNDVDVHTFHVLDAAAAAVTNPAKDN